MTTRLDRLLLLLSTGSTPIVRQTAAKQLGSIAAQRIARPSTSSNSSAIYHGLDGEWNEVVNLLVKVLPFLRSKQWETRSAAALAVECIVKAAGVWDPLALHDAKDADQDKYDTEPSAVLRDFNLAQVILQGNHLLASSGNEYAGGPSGTSGRQDLVKSLGLSVPGAGDDEFGIDVDEELREGALQSNGTGDMKGKGKTVASSVPAAVAPKEEEQDLSQMSARERNALKRKRKQAGQGTSPAPGPPSKARKVDTPTPSASTSRSETPNPMTAVKKEEEDTEGPQKVTIAYKGPKTGQAAVKESDEEQSSWLAPSNEWPFKQIVASLREGLLHHEWEIRHGAALGLREILKVQGRAGGTNVDLSLQQNHVQHQEWADALAVDLLTVLALDRFGDFVGDQVMAPVRETASQTLSALLVHMPHSSVLRVLDLLSAMVRQEEVKAELERQAQVDPESRKGKRNYYWEVKHAGLLGLKYLVAVRRDLFEKQDDVKPEPTDNGTIPIQSIPDRPKRVENVLDTAILGLSDKDDDVRSVAASVLLPLANLVVTSLPQDKTLLLLDMLYLSLGDLRDDLSSSVGNVMDLLSKLLQFPTILQQMQGGSESRSLAVLIPKLFPFFRHTITGVRKAVVEAVNTFLNLPTSTTDNTSRWVDARLLRMLYQNLIVEQNAEIRETSLTAWQAAISRLSAHGSTSALVAVTRSLMPSWFDIVMTPVGQPLNTNHFWKPSEYDANATGIYNIDKPMVKQDLALVSVEQILKGRLAAVEALAAALGRYPPEAHEASVGPLLSAYMTSASSHQLSFSSIIVTRWAEMLAAHEPPGQSPLLARLASVTLKALESDPAVSYSETVGLLTQIHTHCQQLLGIFKNKGKIPANHLPVLDPPHQGFSLARAQQLAGIDYQALLNIMPAKSKPAALPLLQDLALRIQSETLRTAALKEAMDIQVFSSIAGAVVALKQIPTKLNPLIRSLMNGIKFETNPDLQKRTAAALASFISLCNQAGASMKSNPSDKIIKNVCSFLCQDQILTPLFSKFKATSKGIITPRDVGGSEQIDPMAVIPSSKVASLGVTAVDNEIEDEAARKTKLVRRGAEFCLQALASRFGQRLFEQVPRIWLGASQALTSMTAEGLDTLDHHCSHNDAAAQELLDALTVLDALCAVAPSTLRPRLMEVLPRVIIAIQSKYAVVRYVAVRCLVTMSDSFTEEAMKSVVLEVIPLIADPSSTARRRGATELIAGIIDRLDIRVLPYITFLVVPVLGRMTDSDEETRVLATRTFASLVKLVPLEADIPDPPGFPKELLQKRDEERKFLLQLLGGGKVEDYELPIKVSVELRRYQRDGINWLAFLARYQLHGILCDDMGLGKTLQTICILGSKIKERADLYAVTKSPSAVHLPSLVVCPPTLVGHWRHEIHTYVPELSCTIYGGDRQERIKRATSLKNYDIVITSYDVVRNDIEALQPIDWNYCVLDEGHIIKNGKTKLSKAIKSVRANHRLILSGTPIQNNVLELWNLFDFLMPGFLGTEEAFNRRYGKPIQQSRDAKSSSKDQEAGALALEALHKQVLPFVLRRLKEDVLDDLPPKIIQDYYCDLSPLQRDLYENFTKASEDEQDQYISKVEDDEEAKPVTKSNGPTPNTHVFQTLQYLRRLVNHPTLVIQPDRQDHQRILAKHGLGGAGDSGANGNVQDITQAPKLMALKQLLLDSGIGTQSVKSESNGSDALDLNSDSAVAPHRVLIFCQLKSMLDLIENSLFAKHLPSVSYMRLDGSTPPHKRHSVVQTFNADPSIDVLLLTTHVGGLGLNLTGADTVIFVEHDWNPMRDLQAMDRAHRLGQKRVVNVYRLITKGTLEEKIMGLQRFKMNIASTVVSQQNSDLATMDTENVLDLFAADQDDASGGKQKKEGKLTQKEILQNLEKLDDDSDEYRDMGDATRFADSLMS